MVVAGNSIMWALQQQKEHAHDQAVLKLYRRHRDRLALNDDISLVVLLNVTAITALINFDDISDASTDKVYA